MSHPTTTSQPSSAATVNEDLLNRAHIVPFAVFMAMLILLQLADSLIGWDHPQAPWWRRDPAYWVYPVQTLVALGLLWRFRRAYTLAFSWKWVLPAVGFGTVGIALWLLPTTLYDHWKLTGTPEGWMKWLGIAARKEGFDPYGFDHPLAVAATLGFRVLRAVVAVALVEEIFWRGFLMRFVNDWEGNYWLQPFGRATWKSFVVVTGLFVLVHGSADYAGALVYGSLTYLLCVWSKSLAACVIMHATANLLMCGYILAYGKFGLW